MDTRATDYDNVADNVVCCGGGGGGDEQHDGQLNEDDDGEGSSSGFAESISLVPKQAEGHLSVSVAEQVSYGKWQASHTGSLTKERMHLSASCVRSPYLMFVADGGTLSSAAALLSHYTLLSS